MLVWGLDISTKIGSTVVDTEGGKPRIVEALKITSKNSGWHRCSDLAVSVMEVYRRYRPDVICIEGYAHGAKFSQQVLFEVGSIIRYFLWQEDIKYYDVAPTSLKKFVTGKGVATKDTIIKEVFKRFSYDTDDNDIADSVGLAFLAAAISGANTGLPKNHLEALTAVLKVDK